MLIARSFLDDLRARLRLSDIVGRSVKLTRAGREFRGCCPFHHEKSPSFYVNDEKGFYHCFGCGAHGDHVGFLIRQHNKPFMEAVEELAAQAGLAVPRPSPQEVERASRQDRLIGMMEKATAWYQSQLFADAHADILAYVRNRGLNDDTIQAFRLGYAPDDFTSIRTMLKQQGYTDEEMIEGGLVKKSKRAGDPPYAFFRDRVMFPVTNRRGQTIAFGARVLPETLRPLAAGAIKPPKYINSGDTVLFQKGQVLFNESNARAAAGKGAPVIVCEGYADVITLWQAGFAGAVAPLGTALTESQIERLWAMIPDDPEKPVREPLLCFDGDGAGQRAATRSMERILPLLQAGRSARFVFLPDGLDPDDMIRARGAKAFEGCIEAARPLSDMVWQTIRGERAIDTPEARATLLATINTVCQTIADRSVQTQYASMLKERFYETVRAEKEQARPQQTRMSKGQGGTKIQLPRVNLPKPNTQPHLLRLQVALGTLLQHPHLFDDIEEALGKINITDSRLRDLRARIMTHLGQDHMTHESLSAILAKEGFTEEISALGSILQLHGRFALPPYEPDLVLQGLKEALRSVA